MEALNLILDALNWPAVALLLGVFALFLFRQPITRMIDRTSKVSKEGASFEPTQEKVSPTPPPPPLADLMRQPVSASVLSREAAIAKDLSALQLSDADKQKLLIRAAALQKTERDFVIIASHIFGSQVNLLTQLSGIRGGMSRQEAEAAFQQAKAAFPDLHSHRPFEQWVEFLQQQDLIMLVTGERIDITDFGTDFLKFLLEAGLAFPRAG